MATQSGFLSDEERLKAENDFLKMKIMLENGGDFYQEHAAEELPADVENDFLNHIVEYEKQLAEQKTIKVFDRLEKPQQFKRVNEISDSQIDAAYRSLLEYLAKYGIGFDVCSPNISARELYRFITEELFEYEMQDIRIPGMMSNFIYDEFYPDPVYDSSREAEDCIRFILEKEPLEFMHHCRSKSIKFNDYDSLNEDECIEIINRFKVAYDDLEINEINVLECVVDDKKSLVRGNYNVTAMFGNEYSELTGEWRVNCEMDQDLCYWCIENIQITGIHF